MPLSLSKLRLMLCLVFVAFTLCIATTSDADAQSYAIRDREGCAAGYVVPGPSGGADIRARDRRRIGTVEEMPGTRRDRRSPLSRLEWRRPSR